MQGMIPTLAFELANVEEEREVRAFFDAFENIDYYILRKEGLNESVVSYGVLVISSGSFIDAGKAINPRT